MTQRAKSEKPRLRQYYILGRVVSLDPKEIGGEVAWATIFVVLGLAGITGIQLLTGYIWLWYPPIRPTMDYYNVTLDNWNTVRAIWFAEVPLAYLLRRVLGSWRMEELERVSIHTQNTIAAFQYHGIKSVEHLEYHSLKTEPEDEGWLINLDTNKRYRCNRTLSDAVDGLRITKKPPHPSQEEFDKYCEQAKPLIERVDTIPDMENLKPVGRDGDVP